jgi:hypothetical protein
LLDIRSNTFVNINGQGRLHTPSDAPTLDCAAGDAVDEAACSMMKKTIVGAAINASVAIEVRTQDGEDPGRGPFRRARQSTTGR